MTDAFAELVERGNQARFAGRLEEAEACLRQALALRPDNAPAQANLGLTLLAMGRYAEGWNLYEARKQVWRPPIAEVGIAEWAGEDLRGRSLLIWPEQGLGDEIQMARFAPVLAQAGAIVLLACSPPLGRLFAAGLPGVRVALLVEGVQLPRTHAYALNFSLPARLDVTAERPPPAPYLQVPSAPRTGGVGFVWRGNPQHPNDGQRSLPSPDLLEPLREVADLVDLQTPQGDFLDTAARVQALDLVITVDTAMAHLCGALGVPCWVMLPAHWTDWRWGREGETTPWYPSLRLYRQPAPGNWAQVVERMRRELVALGSSRT
jgi:hypothetical protein